ncbi:16S rRNA (cytosine(1402)-N(4))-methyltransferase, partial [Arthrospira platensis SPKY1]|nr:16S rRNA (cytosine(1402)-N(4))-methyltransferase [Arthrospira platensis SPKY1]
QPFENTKLLVELLRKLSPPKKETQFLARVFQALRMEVNQEMDALKEMLLQCESILKPGGRLAIISYHSLEDRLVKVVMRSGNLEDKPEEDFFGNKNTPYKLITRK